MCSSIVRLLLLVLLAGCAGQRTSSEPLMPPESFPSPAADFNEYRERVEKHLTKVSLPHRTTSQIALNVPFEKKASPDVMYRGKFLLIHGLNDSAFVWRDMASALANRGYDVRVILLPGHGSHPRQMLEVSYKLWLSVVRQHFTLWNTDDTPIFLGGFSLGGVLATVLALENTDVDGLLLVSPAYVSQLNSYLRWAWLYRRFRPWMFGGMILEDNPAKYNSIPINSVDQYYRATRYLNRKWRRSLDLPVMMVLTADDSVVDIDAVRHIFENKFSNENRLLLMYGNEGVEARSEREIVRRSDYPELRILNQSHLSLINAPDNELMGRNGSLLVCNGNTPDVFFGCMAAQGHWFGAQHTPSPDQASVARTTYNPDFDGVLDTFDRVFNQ